MPHGQRLDQSVGQKASRPSGCSPPSDAGQSWRGFSALTSRASSRGGYGARFTSANCLVWTKRYASPSIGRWIYFSARTFARFMTSRPAPVSIAGNTARQRSGITANTSEPQKPKPPFQTDPARIALSRPDPGGEGEQIPLSVVIHRNYLSSSVGPLR